MAIRYARLVSLWSPDIDVERDYPVDPDNFLVNLVAEIGAVGSDGSDAFRFRVCTPKWLSEQTANGGAVWGQGLLVVDTWDVERVRLMLASLCGRIGGETWEAIVEGLSRYVDWEFRGMSPAG